MTEPPVLGNFTERQRELLRSLRHLAADRAAREEAIASGHEEETRAARTEHEEGLAAVRHRRETDLAAAKERMRETIAKLERTGKRELQDARAAEADERARITDKADENEREARTRLDEAVWASETVYEAKEDQPDDRLRAMEAELNGRRQELRDAAEEARKCVRRYRQRPVTPAKGPDEALAPDDEAYAIVGAAADRAAADLERLQRLPLAQLFVGIRLPILGIVLVGAAVALAAWRASWRADGWVAGSGGGAFAAVLVASAILYLLVRTRVRSIQASIEAAVAEGLAACDAAQTAAAFRRDREAAALVAERDAEIAAARAKYGPILERIAERRAHHVERIEEHYPALRETIRARGREEIQAARDRHAQRHAEIEQAAAVELEAIEKRNVERMAAHETEHARAWDDLVREWRDGVRTAASTIERIENEARRLFPAWSDERWTHWAPPHEFTPSIRFGALFVDRARFEGGLPTDPRLDVACPVEFTLPATLDFPDRCSLLVLADGPSRERSVGILQAAMLRLLTGLPPGKVRFTIIDPVGLGETFAGFMHLADYDDAFVNGRIWTESRHIEQRLTDLTEHMETVIQKYLRNEFESIADYNEDAGEIAEPYRFLVIADFPTNFSEMAAQRLASIISSGARCGVHTLISLDQRQKLPPGIDRADIEAQSTVIAAADDHFVWKDEDFADLPLTVDEPAPERFVTEKLHLVGEASKDATRVEVPFRVVAPPEGDGWSRSCTEELTVPLGRAGATKLQQLAIGTGTSQHALIAGKTGSGKSTLLHVLITNIALWYSPDEVEVYLVDFKKGVEFKTYATHALPHARAVAIESDREFGLSVLQRIDEELKARGDRFRELGVQDLAGYRRLGLPEPIPRTLLIVDEFQEIFVEDDKLGQDAALLMDRLVRQGRAFGVHVLLGSQTLGGAYTLARSTMGQMQIRIALQCSEADSYLIMSDDNAAARLLSRPGEAIYNDAGGSIVGNSPFQIVWLADDERDRQLDRVRTLARERGYRRHRPTIVFEGNVPADIDKNHLLAARLDAPAADGPPHAWLGEAIAIKDPTSAAFRRQSGSNLLVVGQQDEPAVAMSASAMLSLAAQGPPAPADADGPGGGARFVLLDGTPADAPLAGYLERVADTVPNDTQIVGYRDVEEAMAKLAEEVRRRQEADVTDPAPLFLFVHGLQRFRMLRAADDFGFSLDDEEKPPSPDKLFAEILREGPVVGVHAIIWCDTATNLTRTLERSGLREFEMRVLFQMSGADSTQLVDSPAADKLGLQRALFHSEELGILEKFRPYALPDAAWIARAGERLRGDRTAPATDTDPGVPAG